MLRGHGEGKYAGHTNEEHPDMEDISMQLSKGIEQSLGENPSSKRGWHSRLIKGCIEKSLQKSPALVVEQEVPNLQHDFWNFFLKPSVLNLPRQFSGNQFNEPPKRP